MGKPITRSRFSIPPSLYGRDSELRVLDECLRSAREGRGQLALISGVAGIGKTSLIDAAIARADPSLLELRGAAYDLGSTPPYGPWIELLRSCEHLAGMPDPPAIASSLDALDSISGGPALFEDVAAFLLELSSRTPLALVLEDLQWADHASVELLRHLARRLSSHPIALLVTYRDDELTLGDPLYALLPQIVRETNATRVALRPLQVDAIRALVDDRFPLPDRDADTLTSWLARLAEGNPFFISELLLTLEHEGAVAYELGAWKLGDLSAVRVPSLILQLVDTHLEQLDESARRLLQVAAVIGLETPIDLWATVSGASDDELASAIAQAQEQRLLVEARGRPSLVFHHALIREALYYGIVLPRRRALHGQVAAALLAQSSPDPDALAHHLLQARDERAAEWLARAGARAVRQFAWRTGVDRFQAARDLLEGDDARSLDRAWLLYGIGMFSRRFALEDSIRSLTAALALARACDDTLLTGVVEMDLGLLRCINGAVREGLEGIESGIRKFAESSVDMGSRYAEGSIPAMLAALLPSPESRRGMYVNWLAMSGRFEEAIAAGEALIPLIPDAPPQPRYDDYYDAFIGLAQAYASMGRPDDARVAFDRARAGYSSLELIPWAYFRAEAFCLATYWLDKSERRQRLWDLVGDAWRRTGGVHSYQTSRDYRLELLYYLRGEWDDAVDSGEMILSRGSAGIAAITTRVVLGYICVHRGQIDRAKELARSIRAEHDIDTFGCAWFNAACAAHGLEAAIALAEGDIAGADAALARQRSLLEQSRSKGGYAELELALASRARVAGDSQAAERHARTGLRLASEPRQPLTLMRAHRMLAELAIERGAPRDASQHAAQSVDIARACDTPFELALSQITSASLHLAMGRADDALADLAAAREVCERLGAAPALARVAALEHSAQSASRAPKTVGGLSERELEVLRLVAQGLSDAEVAERLYISRRTVGGHLQSIYSKLDVTSRTAAVAFAFENKLI